MFYLGWTLPATNYPATPHQRLQNNSDYVPEAHPSAWKKVNPTPEATVKRWNCVRCGISHNLQHQTKKVG